MEHSKPHILLVIEGTFPWYRGGVSEWIFQYLTACFEYKFTVLQIATDEYSSLDPSNALYEIPGNVEQFWRVPPPDFTFNWETDSNHWFHSSLKSFCNRENTFDLIHVTNTGFAGWLGKEFSKKLNLPLILTEHALYWKEIEIGTTALECGYKIPQKRKLKFRTAKIFRSIAREVYNQANKVISVSKTNLKYQMCLGARSPLYIPNGVEYSGFSDKSHRSPVLTIGWVGRCAKMKNPLKFLDFAGFLFKMTGKAVHFKMVTCNANEKELNRMIKNRTKNLPFIDVIWDEPAINHITKMNMLCITSINESQPLVLFEALSKKVLPVGWQVGDFTPEFGLAVPPGTSNKKLAEQILNLWDDSKAFKSLINEKYTSAKLKHNWTTIFKSYQQIIESEFNISNHHEELI